MYLVEQYGIALAEPLSEIYLFERPVKSLQATCNMCFRDQLVVSPLNKMGKEPHSMDGGAAFVDMEAQTTSYSLQVEHDVHTAWECAVLIGLHAVVLSLDSTRNHFL